MAPLSVTLLDGFANDLVVVRVDGKEIFRKDGVTTKLLLGCADSVETQAPPGTIRVEIALPARNLTRAIPVRVPEEAHLCVSIEDGGIAHRVSARPFGCA